MASTKLPGSGNQKVRKSDGKSSAVSVLLAARSGDRKDRSACATISDTPTVERCGTTSGEGLSDVETVHLEKQTG